MWIGKINTKFMVSSGEGLKQENKIEEEILETESIRKV